MSSEKQTLRQQIDDLLAEYEGYDDCKDPACISYQGRLELLDSILAVIKGLPAMQEEGECKQIKRGSTGFATETL